MNNVETIPLNKEQRKLVEESHNLIYKYIYLHGLSIEEHYGILAIGLCNAARIYDTKREIAFSTLAFTCFKTEMLRYYKSEFGTQKNKINSEALSLNVKVAKEDGDVASEYVDLIPDEFAMEEYVENKILLERVRNIVSQMGEKELFIFEERLNGKTMDEIGKKLGISKQRVDQIQKQIIVPKIRFLLSY